jgi:hypothetical protein
MTKVLLIAQDKGGVGKSLICRGLAEVVPGAPVIEVDASPRMIELGKRAQFFKTRADRIDIESSPCNPDPASPMHRIRCRGRYRLAPGQAPFREDIRSFVGIRVQVPVPQIRRQVMGSFHARCRTSLAPHDVRRLATDLGAQHSRRRVTAILDHVSNDGQCT